MNVNTMPLAGGSAAQLYKQEYIDNVATNTWYDVRNDMFGDIWDITPFLDMLNTKGAVKSRMPNGRYFEIPITYEMADQNAKFFGRGDTFAEGEKELWTRLQYERKNLGDSIVRYWDDEMKNKGRAQIRSYVKDLLENHKETLQSTLATALWSNPTSNPLSVNTLPELISTTPTTGTVGGLDRSAQDYTTNQHTAMTGTLADVMIPTMRTMWNDCSLKRGKGRLTPDCIITTQALHEEYEEQMDGLGRFSIDSKGDRAADLGFGNLSFKGAPVYWDPECPAGNMYFLNSSTMEFAYDPDAWMEMTKWKEKHNGLDRYAQIVTVCNLLFTNFNKNGVISAMA